MRIPEKFKRLQKELFQDKEIAHRPAVIEEGRYGASTKTAHPEIAGRYRVNFQLLSDALVAQEWGLVVAQDAKVTSSAPLPINNGDYVQFEGKVYEVVGVLHYDSHDALMLKWRTQEVAI